MGRVNHPTLTPARTSKVAQRVVYVLLASFLSFIIPAVVAPQMAHAASAAPICAAGVGQGGAGTSNYLTTDAGNGCVIIKYVSGGSTFYENFNYTGVDQSWTVPTGVTSATFYLIGAGGGGGIYAGGGGGYASGSYSLTSGQVLKIIVGQGGGGVAAAAVTGYVGKYTPLTYGGGGRGGSYGGTSANWFGSGGGRSAIRLPSASTDLVTAAGGGGGSYSQCGFGGGGTSGLPAVKSTNSGTGGTQTAGGTGGPSGNGYPGTNGSAYQGGDSKDEGGGGGGGYFGGGGGGDNYGGGGGSSYIALLTSGATNAGVNCGAAGSTTDLSYVVTYDPNSATSGSAPGNTTVALAGQTLTLATNSGNLARTGYTFAGWNTQADGSGTNYAVSATTFPISGDVTLYAQWNSVITYNANGATSGTIPASQTIIGNATATLAGNTGTLAKTNFTFSGWNTASDGSGTNYPASQTGYVASGNATLYAQWNSTITYNANGSTSGTVPSAQTATGSATISLQANSGSLVKTGNYFVSWNTLANGTGTVYFPGNNYSPTGNVTLYAQYVPACSSTTTYTGGYTIQTFSTTGLCYWAQPSGVTSIDTLIVGGGGGGGSNLGGGGGGGQVDSSTATSLSGPLIIYVGAGGAGGTGIYNSGTNNGRTGSSSYIWDGTTKRVALPGNGGRGRYNSNNGVTTGGFTGGGSAYPDAGYATSATPNTGSGGTAVDGGDSDSSGTGGGGGAGGPGNSRASNSSGGIGIASSITGTSTYYGGGGGGAKYGGTAVWTGAGGLGGGGQGANGSAVAVTSGSNGLGGGGGSDYNGTAGGAGGSGVVIIRYASKFTVTFDANGGTGTASSATITQSAFGASITLATAGTLARTGYTLTGWNTAADGTGTGYSLGATYTPATPITLYAFWTGITYSVTYHANGATSGSVPSPGSYTTGGNVYQIAGNTGNLALGSYSFGGWNSASNISGTTFAGSATYSTPANLDLYAIWNSTITYNANGSTGGTAPAAQLDVGSAATTLAANSGTLAKTNFTFGGWNTAADGSGTSYPASSAYTPTGNITLYAQWNSVLTFNTNGAASGSPSISSITDTGTATVLLPTVGSMIKTGYSFLGWSASSTSSTATYLPGASYVSTGTTTLYAIWSANSYAITFNANGATGSMANEAIVAGTAKALTTNTLTRTGYTFTGWNTLAAGGGTAYVAGATVTLYANLTLYAQWTANTYAVTFASNTATGCLPVGCLSMANQSFTAGTAFTLSTNTWYKTGYTFAGWSTSSGVQAVLYSDAQSVTLFGNTSIYAQWTASVYVVSYSANGGTGAPSAATQNWTYGTSGIATLPTVGTMSKTGYSFGGWTTTPTGTTAVTTPYTPASSLTLYAIWTPQPQAVTFNGNGSTGGSMLNQSITAGTATALTANSFSRTGYSFAGWNSSADGTGTTSYTNSQSVTIYAPMTIYAQWAILAPSVPTISVTGGNTTATISITSSETNTATAGAPNSYTVTAYSGTTASGTCTVIPVATSCIITGLTNGTAYTFKAVATNTTGSATSLASAAVTPAPYTVTYNAGSVGTVTTTSANTTYNAGTPVTLPTPTATGYTFTGWYSAATGGSFVGSPNSSYSPASSTTLYATWTANTYTISYDANGGTGTTPSNGSYQTGGTVYPIAAGTGISKPGYNFTAWNTAIDGTGTTYTPPVNYSTPAALTLYAKWTAISRTITYAANGGTGTVPNQSSLIIGQTFTVASGSALSKANYTFGGWSDGTNIYLAGATYTIATSNVTLTAQWTPVQYVVTYAANGGAGSVPVDVTHAATTTVTVLGVGSLTRDGYSFAGWSDGTTTYQASNTFSMPASNITLTAQWSPATFTITYSNNTGTGSASRTTDSFLNGSPAIGLPTIGTLAKAGYTFAGWSETNTVTATAIVGSYAPTKSITLYAVWSPGTYAITYNANGASGSPTGATTSYTTGTAGVTLSSATGMTKSGYTLSGWSLTPTGSVISGAFAPTTDTTVYAIWAPASIAITFAPGDASGIDSSYAAPGATQATFATNYTLPASDSATVTNGTVTKAFVGWSDGTSTYKTGSTYLMGASSVLFTAQWVTVYTLHYSAMGGTGAPADVSYTDGATATISAVAPTRVGYDFVNWIDQSSGTVLPSASNYHIDSTHYLLYAVWSPKTCLLYTSPSPRD